MTDPVTEATEAAHRAYLSDMQDCVEDAVVVVKSAIIGEGRRAIREQFEVIAFELVLKAMLDDLGGSVEQVGGVDHGGG